MEVDFDKQIDTILRDLAKGAVVAEAPPKSHLDADELAAFAEKALPAKARFRVTDHLADCSDCRKILATLVTLNLEAESERIHEGAQPIVSIPAIPWYRQLFAFPQLAYTMGALVLVFSGMIGYLVLQTSKDSEVNVAQANKTTERTIGPSGADSDGEGRVVETYSANSNVALSANSSSNVAAPAANTAANSSAPVSLTDSPADKSGDTTAPPAAPMTSATPATVGPEVEAKVAEKPGADLKTNKDIAKEEVVSKKDGDVTSSKVANEQPTMDDVNISRQQVQTEPNLQVQRNQNNVMMPDGSNQSRNMPAPAPVRKSETRRDEADNRGGESVTERERAKKKVAEDKPAVLKTVAGKTFRFDNGTWTDSTYTGGSTKTVRRGTDEYKKLDSGLQNIGSSFNETVIVRWNGKNYKIQ